MLSSISARVNCPHCDVSHAADKDEDGIPELDLMPCQGSDSCFEKLCQDCRQMCDFCGLWACGNHIATNADGLRICDICREDVEPECECRNVTGRWDLEETWDARDCPLHGPREAA